jgi:hypothetical protein
MKCLTIDALWCWAIVVSTKRVENRTWRTKYRGPLALHAGRNRSRDAEALAFLRKQGLDPPTGPALDALRGHVLATCELVDVVEFEWRAASGEQRGLFSPFAARDSSLATPFAFGPQCWVLDDVRPLEAAVPAVGRQMLWEWRVQS